MIVFSHIRDTDNTGDTASCPAQWFDFPEHRVVNYDAPVSDCDAIVYGGGTMNNWLQGRQDLPLTARARIAWGIGSSRHGEKEPWPDPDFDLVGVREYTKEREADGCYVPCVSCMSPLFDVDYPMTSEAVIFHNASDSIKSRYPITVGGLPTMNNEQSLENIIAFLGSAETIITNSYHGIFWGKLLNRMVVCVPYSSKFYGFKYTPAYSDNGGLDWRGKEHQMDPNALEDSRAVNMLFYNKVLEITGAR